MFVRRCFEAPKKSSIYKVMIVNIVIRSSFIRGPFFKFVLLSRRFCSVDEEGIFLFPIMSKGKEIQVTRNSDWEVNMTELGTKLNKRWRNWLADNKKLISTMESLEGQTLTRVTDNKRYPQTYAKLVLAIAVLADWDPIVGYQVFKRYEADLKAKGGELSLELAEYREKLELSNAEIAKLLGKGQDVPLILGPCLLYAYTCNEMVKFGTSFTNKKGERPKSHRTSVPNLALGFVIYGLKEHLQKVNREIKARFNITGKEHARCTIEEMEDFVRNYMELMNYPYKQESVHTLRKLHIFLK